MDERIEREGMEGVFEKVPSLHPDRLRIEGWKHRMKLKLESVILRKRKRGQMFRTTAG